MKARFIGRIIGEYGKAVTGGEEAEGENRERNGGR